MAKFQKGVSGNPAGRKPGSKAHVSRELEKIVKAGGGKVAKEIAQKLTNLTLEGNTQAAKLLLERLEGRVPTVEELAKKNGANEPKLTDDQRLQKLRTLLSQPALRGLLEEIVKPGSERIQ